MAKANELIKVAIAELGYCEKETNKNLDDKTANAGDGNWTKYARDLHTAGYYQAPKNGYAWCDMFVDWCCLQLMGNKKDGEYLQCQTGLYGAGCEWSSDCYRRAGRFGKDPQVGAQIFFGKTDAESHTGIVEKFDETYVYTIEGNTSNKVARRTYKRTDSYIVGYGYMRFDEEEAPEAPEAPKQPETTAAVKVGDVVKIATGAVYYDGVKKVPSWVIAKQWIVKSVGGDRIVINKSTDGKNEICSPINVKYLTKVGSGATEAPAQPAKKTNEELAKEVIRGLWGNGAARKQKLEAAGYNYREVQNIVNEMLR